MQTLNNMFNQQYNTNMKIHAIAAATLCTILLAACNNNPEEAVNHFYAATQANDFEKALTYTNIAEEEREGVIDVLSEMGMVIHSFKVNGSTIDEGDTTATVDLHIVTSNAFHPDSMSDDIKVPCIKSSNRWQVKMI